jgi:hypothetical protein
MLLLRLSFVFVFCIQNIVLLVVTEVVSVETAEKSFFTSDEIDSHNIEFVLNPGTNVCRTGTNQFLLVYVHSKPDNLKRRQMIRETWAKQILFKDMRLVFMTGKTMEVHVSSLLAYEYNTYMDIVQGDFIDSYRNLTYKGRYPIWLSF